MLEIGIDIGGTFTDIACLEDGRTLHMAKVPTTPGDLVKGVRDGIEQILAIAGRPPAAVARFLHSTTIATNAILEQKGAVTGVLMTEGFEDALEIGRQKRSDMYDLDLDGETPAFLAPRRLRVGIRERLDARGNVLVPLDEAQLLSAVAELRRRHGVESLAVCYLFSFLNPAHERRTRELIAEHFPEITVSLSSEVNPVFREYERVALTAFDAYVRPRVADYMARLAGALRRMGIEAHLQVMQSRGGVTTVESAVERPVTMLLSGPAAGVIGGRFAGERSGERNLITIDIGGTSCDVALIKEGKPLISREGRIRRYPLRIPMVDVSTVGAGGGSLAWIDPAGGLRVGPESAGADPGPVCYGRGGTTPTVTDASLVLGYLNPDYFAGGQMRLDPDAARAAMAEMAKRLSMTPEQLASGIHRIINARMGDEIRLVSVRRGYDPRQFTLVLLGGAGPVHGGRLARMLGIPAMIVPQAPGVLCAFGLLVAAVEHEQSRTFTARSDGADRERLEAVFADLDRLGREKMARDRVPAEAVRVSRFADLRYVGQSYELEVALPDPLGADGLELAVAEFHAVHARIYGHSRPGHPVEIVNVRTVHATQPPEVRLAPPPGGGSLARALAATRPAWFEELGGWRDTPVYRRDRLPIGEPIEGPAIIEQPDTTTVVYPGQILRVETSGNMRITVQQE